MVRHFEEIAEDNEALDRKVIRVEPLTTLDLPAFPYEAGCNVHISLFSYLSIMRNDWEKYALYGTQTIAKHNEQVAPLCSFSVLHALTSYSFVYVSYPYRFIIR